MQADIDYMKIHPVSVKRHNKDRVIQLQSKFFIWKKRIIRSDIMSDQWNRKNCILYNVTDTYKKI